MILVLLVLNESRLRGSNEQFCLLVLMVCVTHIGREGIACRKLDLGPILFSLLACKPVALSKYKCNRQRRQVLSYSSRILLSLLIFMSWFTAVL